MGHQFTIESDDAFALATELAARTLLGDPPLSLATDFLYDPETGLPA